MALCCDSKLSRSKADSLIIHYLQKPNISPINDYYSDDDDDDDSGGQAGPQQQNTPG